MNATAFIQVILLSFWFATLLHEVIKTWHKESRATFLAMIAARIAESNDARQSK
jgi:hypothetical protein